MKKNVRLVSLLLMILLATSMVFVGCAKNGKTLENYVANDPNFQEQIDAMFAEQGVSGTMEVKGNDIIMTIDMTEQLNSMGAITDEMKDVLKSSFEGSFNGLKDQMAEQIKGIEEAAGVKGVTMQIKVLYKDEVLYEHTFTA